MKELLEPKALLEKFVTLAPKEFCAKVVEYATGKHQLQWIDRLGSQTVWAARLDDDYASAEAIVFLWDWLDAQGMNVLLRDRGVVVCGSENINGILICDGEDTFLPDGHLYVRPPFSVGRVCLGRVFRPAARARTQAIGPINRLHRCQFRGIGLHRGM